MKIITVIISFLLFLGILFFASKAIKSTHDLASPQTNQTVEETAKDAVDSIRNNANQAEDPTLAP